MKVEQKGHTTILKNTEGDIVTFVEKIGTQYNSYKNQNLVLDISHVENVDSKALKSFSDIAKMHKKNKKSLVILAKDIDFNSVSGKIVVVPSLQEAHDIIEMEEIERDLGF
jgi:phage anti-repressor protein